MKHHTLLAIVVEIVTVVCNEDTTSPLLQVVAPLMGWVLLLSIMAIHRILIDGILHLTMCCYCQLWLVNQSKLLQSLGFYVQ